ncbi:tetratricopeptide repeat protein, partial [Streptomyces sp. NPDC051636]|uniref:tetratricopeptide repeat protein n=1 Tax=Streptomyces sp. NPDC051636 TaxID=3365663 RepID=UPI0037A10141
MVVGLGGVGKTQLAAHYARMAWQAGELDVLVWITATTAAGIINGYAKAAAELLGAAASDDPELAAATFLAWLEPKAGQRTCRWLVVLDDVTDPVDLNTLWPSVGPTGRTLVTTRRQEAALITGRRLIPIGVFTPAESLAYLSGALVTNPQTTEHLADLAEDLGDLPLALSQAAAYLTDTGTSVAGFRQLLADHATRLRDATPDTLPDGQPLAVAATWSLSIEHANTLRPTGLARPMLQLAAFLNPNGIPEAVLTSPPARAFLARQRSAPDSQPLTGSSVGMLEDYEEVTHREARTALSALRRLSLVEHTPNVPHLAVRVHQLVQRSVRDALTPDQRDDAARAAADALTAAWPDVESDVALAQALRVNATALANLAGDALYQPDAHAVLYRTGSSLGEAGQLSAARNHFRHVAKTSATLLGSDHLDTLTARGNLARWQGEAGDAAGAAKATTDLLERIVQVLGQDHPHTLTTRSNLARWQGEAGDAAGAAEATAQLVDDRIRVLGEDHPQTLTTRSNHAYWLGQAGNAPEAADAYTDLLERFVQVLGQDHPHTLTTRSNLARWQGEAGDAAGAAEATAQLLEDRIRVLGEDHPQTLTTRSNLARWRGEAGDAAGAAEATAQLLEDRIRVLGEDHPQTLT